MAQLPATSGIFSFAGDSLFVEASGRSLHRRATLPELRAHFDASADRPAHWYEAQLVHYGLPPSRVKGTAKMRLYDAVKGGGLAVPGHMKSVEVGLKKEWKRQGKGGGNSEPVPATKKRKGDGGDDTPAAKAPRKSAPSTLGKNSATSTPAGAPRARQTARRGAAAASRGGGGIGHTAGTPAAPERKLQTARRGGYREAPARGPPGADGTGTFGFYGDAPSPVPKQEYGDGDFYDYPPSPVPVYESSFGGFNDDYMSPDGMDYDYKSEDSMGYDNNSHNAVPRSARAREAMGYHQGPRPPLGLINGRYEVHEVYEGEKDSNDHWPRPGTLILTLDGEIVWAHLEMQDLTAMLLVHIRPTSAPSGNLGAACRARLHDHYGTVDHWDGSTRPAPGQHLNFLGNGNVRGMVRVGGGRNGCRGFEGVRVSGGETRSEISPWEMRRRWEDILPSWF